MNYKVRSPPLVHVLRLSFNVHGHQGFLDNNATFMLRPFSRGNNHFIWFICLFFLSFSFYMCVYLTVMTKFIFPPQALKCSNSTLAELLESQRSSKQASLNLNNNYESGITTYYVSRVLEENDLTFISLVEKCQEEDKVTVELIRSMCQAIC